MRTVKISNAGIGQLVNIAMYKPLQIVVVFKDGKTYEFTDDIRDRFEASLTMIKSEVVGYCYRKPLAKPKGGRTHTDWRSVYLMTDRNGVETLGYEQELEAAIEILNRG